MIYEISMFATADFDKLFAQLSKNDPDEEKWKHNASFECFLMHARLLALFFYPGWDQKRNAPRKRQGSDLGAEHFGVKGYPRKQPVLARGVHEAISKKVVHLTTKRQKKKWKPAQFQKLTRECVSFLKKVQNSQGSFLTNDSKRRVSELLATLDRRLTHAKPVVLGQTSAVGTTVSLTHIRPETRT